MTTTTTANLDDYSTEDLERILAERHQQNIDAQNKKRNDYEQLKEDTINTLCSRALHLNWELSVFKMCSFDELHAIYQLLQEYSNRHADGDGGFSLENKACTFKVRYAKQALGYFDERSSQAEKHIIDFVNAQFSGDQRTQKLITSLLERQKGKLDIKLVQKLYAMENDYDNPNWKEGIKLLKESWKETESKSYVRYYQKVNGVYELINLNLASLEPLPADKDPEAHEK